MTNQPGDIYKRKSKVIVFVSNADMNIISNHLHIHILERIFRTYFYLEKSPDVSEVYR